MEKKKPKITRMHPARKLLLSKKMRTATRRLIMFSGQGKCPTLLDEIQTAKVLNSPGKAPLGEAEMKSPGAETARNIRAGAWLGVAILILSDTIPGEAAGRLAPLT